MVIEINGIKKNYGKKEVLKNVDLTAHSGQCIGILGGNGCGKSTFLSILAGVNKCSDGSFTLDGQDLFKNTKLRARRVGYVPQGTPLFEELNAYDNLSLWYEKDKIEYELENGILGILGINSFLKTPVGKMSGGMKKRLAIGCAVANSPDVLLLDEPSAALDLICKERISNYLEAFKAKGGIILLATHDVGELGLCDRICIMKNGSLTDYNYDGNVHRLVGSL